LRHACCDYKTSKVECRGQVWRVEAECKGVGMSWQVIWSRKPCLKRPVLVQGMPGIGNAGKVAIDYLIDATKATKLAEFRSFSMPRSVYVGENGLVELPAITLYHVRKSRDMLFLAGDFQPIDEISCNSFCDAVVKICKELGVEEIVTTGGIGLRAVPKKPRVFATGTDRKLVKSYARYGVRTDIYGVVGPIIGVSGMLCGLAGRDGIHSVALLVEVLGSQAAIAVRGSRELLRVLNARFNLKVNVAAIEKEAQELEEELAEKTGEAKTERDVNYIG